MTQYSYSTCITENTDGTLENNCHSYRCDFGYFSDVYDGLSLRIILLRAIA
ncbi:MAG: hypothetical protein KME40_11705 [Komarekiella atlantica HA4396-MV6]|nr:hypothetical protein [Komarekiella atlantica HA4396-MV6]